MFKITSQLTCYTFMLKTESPRKLANVYSIDSHSLSDILVYIYQFEKYKVSRGLRNSPEGL